MNPGTLLKYTSLQRPIRFYICENLYLHVYCSSIFPDVFLVIFDDYFKHTDWEKII